MAPTAAEAYGLLPSLAGGYCPDGFSRVNSVSRCSLGGQGVRVLDRLIQFAILKLKRWNAGEFL